MSLISPQRRLVLAAALAAGVPLVARAAGGKSLRVVTADLPPLVIEHGGQQPGALYQVVIELCKRVELAPAIEILPWKRAIFIASSSATTTIFPLTRLPERERQFRWLAPLYDERYVFLAPRGRAFDVHHPANMLDMRITLIRGSALKSVLLKMGYTNFVEARSIDEVHRFLVAGIADAAYGELSIVRNSLRTRVAEGEFDYSEPVSRTAAWLAGSLDFTEAQAAQFQRAMQTMMADGSYAAILKRYQLG
jgi:ABC-type amino acid transport substrate-binding protein